MTGPEEVGDVDADRTDQQPDGDATANPRDPGGIDAEKAGPQIPAGKPGDEPPPKLQDDPNALPHGGHDEPGN